MRGALARLSWSMTVLKSDRGDRQWFVLYVVVCIEIGIFLTLVPWSAIWERNFFLETYPALRGILLAPAVRGAVAGLGVANIYMGLREVLARRAATVDETSGVGRTGASPSESTPEERLNPSDPNAVAVEERR